MSTQTTIEWADKTWSPIIGCDRVSPGCDRCYAISTARIRESNPNPKIAAAFAGTTERTEDGIDWTGKVNLLPDRLTDPLHWRKPRKVFVNSLSDLFHAEVPGGFIAKAFAIMALTPQHTYQILSKRQARMRSLLGNPDFEKQVDRALLTMPEASNSKLTGRSWPLPKPGWPLPNVWIGCSVEDQKRAGLRIPALLETPAAVRFLSCEPLLGPIDLTRIAASSNQQPGMVYDALGQRYGVPGRWQARTSARVDWVIAGGESGPGARPAALDWFRSLRDQCTQASVPYLFKQHGAYRGFLRPDEIGDGPHREADLYVNVATGQALPDDQVPDTGSWAGVWRLGKKHAGRELDGRTWDEFPEAVR